MPNVVRSVAMCTIINSTYISLLPSSANTADSVEELCWNSEQKITLSLPYLDGRSTQLNYVSESLVTVNFSLSFSAKSVGRVKKKLELKIEKKRDFSAPLGVLGVRHQH